MQTQSCRISVLSESVINQIAAGEVIENPSSVVKKLVENALDAGSSDILVEIERGGQELIRVSDNGLGMNALELEQSLKRHATSKLTGMDDFDRILSMGFRGEAIPSIASISRFKITSKPKDEELAFSIETEGGGVNSLKQASRTQGTTIEVKDLFFNLPVRQKFQKSDTQNLKEVIKFLNNLALANYDKTFRLVSNGKEVFNYRFNPSAVGKTEPFKKRVTDILGKEFSKDLSYVEVNLEGYACVGYIGKPDLLRATRSGQYIFVNKRVVNSPIIANSVKDAFFTQVPTQKFPVFVLYLELPPSKVDVNVHPQKKELRFQEEGKIKELIYQAVKQVSDISVDVPIENEMQFASRQHSDANLYSKVQYQAPKLNTSSYPIKTSWSDDLSVMKKEHVSFLSNKELASAEIEDDLFVDSKEGVINILSRKHHTVILEDLGLVFPNSEASLDKKRWFLVDLKALYTKIAFRDYMSSQRNSKVFGVEDLLIPIQIELNSQEAQGLHEYLGLFEGLGIKIEPFGKDIFIVQSVPSFIKTAPIATIVLDIMEELPKKYDKESLNKYKDKYVINAFSRMASAVKEWSDGEIKYALCSLFSDKDNLFCPKGRKVWSEIKVEDHFKR